MKKLFPKLAVLALVSQVAAAAFAGTTGTVTGTVTGSNGDPMPGVSLLMTSPQLIGSRALVTGPTGKYRAVFLPPGAYEMTATITGYSTQKAVVRVRIDDIQVVDLQMDEQNTLIDEPFVIADLLAMKHTATGATISEDFFIKLPTGRAVSSIMEIVPGVSTQDVDGSYRINGASGPENQYFIDGVNTTSIELGGMSANLNLDFIQEVEIKTGGYNAEFGRATGGILNAITKSGGNEFEGSIFAFYDDRDNTASVGALNSTDTDSDRNDFGVTVGGPIIKDKLWFFVGANPQESKIYAVTPTQLIEGGDRTTSWADIRGESETIRREEDRTAWVAKLTWQLNESNTVTLSGNSDPGDITSRDSSGTFDRDRIRDVESTNLILKWNAILNNIFTLDVSYASHEEDQSDAAVNGNNFSRIYHRSSNPTHDVGGLGFFDSLNASRDDFSIKLGAYLGNHELKSGLQFEETTLTNTRDYSGQGLVRWDGANRAIRVRTFGQVDAGGDIDVLHPQHDSTENEYTSLFIQDSWSFTPNLVLNLGIRAEEQKLLNSSGGTYHTFDNNLAPRLGFSWDFLDDGRGKLFGHWGRFYQTLPMYLNNRANASEILYFRWYDMLDDSPSNILEWNDAEIQRVMDNLNPWLELYFSNRPTTIDPNTKATNHDEIILGVAYEFKTDWAVGFKFVGRSINEVVEDISLDAGNNYIIANPGEEVTYTNGNSTNLEFYDFQGNFVSVAPGTTVTLVPEQFGFPPADRDYNGYEFLLRKSYRDNYQFQFSYVHSSTRGNYIGSTLPDGQVEPGITDMFDLTSTTVNASGLLPQHRRHQVKFDGSYEFDFGLLLGSSYRYTSGAGIDALGNPDVGNGAYSEFHLLPRGSAGRMPGITSFDLNLDYTLKFREKMNLSFVIDVFNVFDAKKVTAVDRQYNHVAPDATAANAPWNVGQPDVATGDDHFDAIIYANRYYAYLEGRFSNLNELEDFFVNTLGYGGATTTYGKPTNYQLGRRTRLGVRFRF